MSFDKGFREYACEGDTIVCEVDGFIATATIYRDDSGDTPDERMDGFWPSHDPKAAGYVKPENYDEQYAIAQRVMDAWNNDEWFYCGIGMIIERAGVSLIGSYSVALWGIECNYPDSDNSYLMTVANDLLPDALARAKDKLRKLCEQS
jgi:hypothetical protein